MGDQPKILVVDDEEVVCECCRRIFAAQGFVVETCTDSRRGLGLAERNRYAAIILDMKMPRLDGIGFLERLREAGIDVPVVVISGRSGEAGAQAAARLGATEYLAKPFTPVEITEAVRRRMAGV